MAGLTRPDRAMERLRGFLDQEEAEGLAVRTGIAFLKETRPNRFRELRRATVQGVRSGEQRRASGRRLADCLRALVPSPDQLLEGIGRRCDRTHRKGRVGCTE